MKASINTIADLFQQTIIESGDIRYIQINTTYVITENPFTLQLELNDLETYDSWGLHVNHIADLLKFISIQRIGGTKSTINN